MVSLHHIEDVYLKDPAVTKNRQKERQISKRTTYFAIPTPDVGKTHHPYVFITLITLRQITLMSLKERIITHACYYARFFTGTDWRNKRRLLKRENLAFMTH